MVSVKTEMGTDLVKGLVESFEVRAVPANGQIPCDICRLWDHQQELVFFGMFPEEWHDFFRAATCAVKHDQQFDRTGRIQSFRDN